jgi:hypothetical protein
VTTRALPYVGVAVVVAVVIDLVLGYSPVPGYAAALGLLGGGALTVAGKILLPKLVSRSPAHYPLDEAPAVQPDVLATGPDPRDADGRPLPDGTPAPTDAGGDGRG